MTFVTFIPFKNMPEQYKFLAYSMEASELPQLSEIINLTIEGSERRSYRVRTRTFFIQERRWEIVLDNQTEAP